MALDNIDAFTRNVVVGLLKPHPLNLKIYGELEPDPSLVQSVKKNGVIVPILTDENNQIISGHNRWKAAQLAGLNLVPRLRFIGTDLEGEALLIESNNYRVKTKEQKARETAELFRIEQALAAERMKVGTLSPEGAGGQTRDIVAAKTGQSKNTVEKQVAIIDAEKSGNTKPMELLKEGKSFAEAYAAIGPKVLNSEKIQTPLEYTSFGTCIKLLEKVVEKLPEALKLGRKDGEKRLVELLKEIENIIQEDSAAA